MATAHLHLLLLAMHTHPLPSRMDSTRALPLLLATWDTPIQLLLQVEICHLQFDICMSNSTEGVHDKCSVVLLGRSYCTCNFLK